jgi:hypothetical protein
VARGRRSPAPVAPGEASGFLVRGRSSSGYNCSVTIRPRRSLALILVVVLALALAVPPRAHADPFLLGSAAYSLASGLVLLGSYLFVANTHSSDKRPALPGLPAMVACTQERDGSTLCWPANQGDPALPAPPVAALEEEVATAGAPEPSGSP